MGWWEGRAGEQNRVPRAPASAEPAVGEGLAPHALHAQQEIQRGLVGHWPGAGLHPNEGTQLCLPVTQILSTGEVPSAEFTACGPCVIQVRPSSHHEERTLVHYYMSVGGGHRPAAPCQEPLWCGLSCGL